MVKKSGDPHGSGLKTALFATLSWLTFWVLAIMPLEVFLGSTGHSAWHQEAKVVGFALLPLSFALASWVGVRTRRVGHN